MGVEGLGRPCSSLAASRITAQRAPIHCLATQSSLRLHGEGRLASVTHSLVRGVLLRGQETEEGAGKDGQGREIRRRKGYWEGRESGRNSSLLLNSSFEVPATVLSTYVCTLTDLTLRTL